MVLASAQLRYGGVLAIFDPRWPPAATDIDGASLNLTINRAFQYWNPFGVRDRQTFPHCQDPPISGLFLTSLQPLDETFRCCCESKTR
jgi:hypothetical protein